MKNLSIIFKASLLMLVTGAWFSVLPVEVLANDRVDFAGEFSSIVTTSSDCDDIFSETDYFGVFQLTGPTRRTLVSNFKHANRTGFFHNQTFVSLFGYNNDFLYEKAIVNSVGKYEVRAEGFVDYSVVYIEFTVKRMDIDCIATATYSGFN